MSEMASINIPYQEMRAINEIVKSHSNAHIDTLNAVIVFGTLVNSGETRDIELLEVVEGWQGPRRVIFGNTKDLPLRGLATFYFLLPEEFEHPTEVLLDNVDFSSAFLLRRVREAYTMPIKDRKSTRLNSSHL